MLNNNAGAVTGAKCLHVAMKNTLPPPKLKRGRCNVHHSVLYTNSYSQKHPVHLSEFSSVSQHHQQHQQHHGGV